MKRLIITFFLISQVSQAQEHLEISILTCSPGAPVYSVFGHSAIRIIDQRMGTDIIYDFGTFDFDTPNFAVKFLKGRLKYHLSERNTGQFISSYTYENRLVTEQKLNLTPQQKRQVLSKLKFLYRPENRYYYYSFLEKDCSTDLRDLLAEVGVDFVTEDLGQSKRDLINGYMEEKPWLRFGVNLILGTSLDQQSSHYQSMFLPDYLMHEVTAATNNGQPLVKTEQNLNSQIEVAGPGIKRYISPLAVFLVFMLIWLFRFPRSLQMLFCLIIGLAGLLIVTLWIFSEHPEFENNFNLLWCNPLYLLYLPLLLRQKSHKLLTSLLSIALIASAIVWLVGWQGFDIAVLPLIIILCKINLSAYQRSGSRGNGFSVSTP